jgi:hypothetical protein
VDQGAWRLRMCTSHRLDKKSSNSAFSQFDKTSHSDSEAERMGLNETSVLQEACMESRGSKPPKGGLAITEKAVTADTFICFLGLR